MNKGFTLIEVMIVMAIVGILASIAIPACQGKKYKPEKTIQQSYQCIEGYKFTNNGVQIINSEKGGIQCDEIY